MSRETGGDQIGVDELLAVCIVRQEEPGEGALPRSVGTRDDEDIRLPLSSIHPLTL